MIICLKAGTLEIRACHSICLQSQAGHSSELGSNFNIGSPAYCPQSVPECLSVFVIKPGPRESDEGYAQ